MNPDNYKPQGERILAIQGFGAAIGRNPYVEAGKEYIVGKDVPRNFALMLRDIGRVVWLPVHPGQPVTLNRNAFDFLLARAGVRPHPLSGLEA